MTRCNVRAERIFSGNLFVVLARSGREKKSPERNLMSDHCCWLLLCIDLLQATVCQGCCVDTLYLDERGGNARDESKGRAEN